MIAIITPILSTARMGYQRTFDVCIESQAAFADNVYLVQSANDPNGLYHLPDNVQLISKLCTWFEDGKHDSERMTRNIALGFARAILDGHKAAILLACNTYIPEYAQDNLRKCVQAMLKDGRDWNFLYRANLLAGHLTYPSKRLPYIVNLRRFPVVHRRDMPDSLFVDGNRVDDEYSCWPEMEDCCAVDAGLEITPDEFAEKLSFVRCHSKAMPKRSPDFNWDYWRPYMLNKIMPMAESSRELDTYGKRIADQTQPDYLGAVLWQAAREAMA